MNTEQWITSCIVRAKPHAHNFFFNCFIRDSNTQVTKPKTPHVQVHVSGRGLKSVRYAAVKQIHDKAVVCLIRGFFILRGRWLPERRRYRRNRLRRPFFVVWVNNMIGGLCVGVTVTCRRSLICLVELIFIWGRRAWCFCIVWYSRIWVCTKILYCPLCPC